MNFTNLIEYASGGLVLLSDSGINEGVFVPIANWITSLFNFFIKFSPVFVFLFFIYIFIGLGKGLFKSKKDKKNKSLENK